MVTRVPGTSGMASFKRRLEGSMNDTLKPAGSPTYPVMYLPLEVGLRTFGSKSNVPERCVCAVPFCTDACWTVDLGIVAVTLNCPILSGLMEIAVRLYDSMLSWEKAASTSTVYDAFA